jgi:hypothetical protein
MLWVNSIMSPGPVRMSDYSSYRFFLYEGPIVMAAEKKAAMVPDRDLVGRLLHADGRFVLLCFSLTYVCTIFVQKEFPFFFYLQAYCSRIQSFSCKSNLSQLMLRKIGNETYEWR